MTPDELLTKKDLEAFKKELFELLKGGIQKTEKQWLKTKDVQKMLGISPGKLQQLRDNGTLTYSKLDGIIFYKAEDIEKALTKGEKKTT